MNDEECLKTLQSIKSLFYGGYIHSEEPATEVYENYMRALNYAADKVTKRPSCKIEKRIIEEYYCSHCCASLRSSYRYCPSCGREIEKNG